MKSKYIHPLATRNTPTMDHPFPTCFRLSLAGLSLLLLTGTAHAAGLTASDAAASDQIADLREEIFKNQKKQTFIL